MKERFIITVQAEGTGGPPVEQRLKRLLKAMLRGYQLRCVSVRPEVTDPTSTVTDAVAATPEGKAGKA